MKIGDILYPAYNEDTRWYRRSFWDVLIKVKSKVNYTKYQRFYNYECAIVFSELIKLKMTLFNNKESRQ